MLHCNYHLRVVSTKRPICRKEVVWPYERTGVWHTNQIGKLLSAVTHTNYAVFFLVEQGALISARQYYCNACRTYWPFYFLCLKATLLPSTKIVKTPSWLDDMSGCSPQINDHLPQPERIDHLFGRATGRRRISIADKRSNPRSKSSGNDTTTWTYKTVTGFERLDDF